MGYIRLEPGRELNSHEYIAFQRGRPGFSELTQCTIDKLEERKAESIALEKEICQRIDAMVAEWAAQAQQTQQYMKALEYIKTPPTPHTSNQWKENRYGSHELSNMVYRFSWREYGRTEWDRALQKSIPKSWELTWSLTFNTPQNPDYSGEGWKIAGQDMTNLRALYEGWEPQECRQALDTIQDTSKQFGRSIEKNLEMGKQRSRAPVHRPSR